MEGSIADVRCTSCGAPAKYDIIRQEYLCGYCGSKVSVREAIAQKQGFRRLVQEKIRSESKNYKLIHAACTGCGASLVFDENEAMADCSFCGRALVRKEYLSSEELPEMIIPFRITEEEAKNCLTEWCSSNRSRREARSLKKKAGEIRGFYLPYELVQGPVGCSVERMDGGRKYHCEGYVDSVLVNCSKQLDNRLLDAMEPYEPEDIKEFDLAYAAGQKIKIKDIDDRELGRRVDEEVAADYEPAVKKTLESDAVSVDTFTGDVLRMPVLLPVYYVKAGDTAAAVNGQTGKVSVIAEKPSHYYFVPWWVKAVLATLVTLGVVYTALRLFGMDLGAGAYICGMLGIYLLIVTLAMYSDTVHNSFRVESSRKVFTSAGGPLHRENGKLVRQPEEIKKDTVPPEFFETLDGKTERVRLVFTSPARVLNMILLALTVLFLPVIIALFLNGFDFGRLELGGSAVWFCITVPTVPIYLLKFGRVDLYENPWIYILDENGKKKKYRKKSGDSLLKNKALMKDVLKAVFIPPASLAVWFGILCFCVICWLTAFGFD